MTSMIKVIRLPFRKFACRAEAVADRAGALAVNDLPCAADFPKAIFGGVVANRNISAFFEAMRYDTAVFAVEEPSVDIRGRRGGHDPD